MIRVSPKVLALLCLLTLLWGTTWPLFHVALAVLPPWTFRALVLIVAALALAPIMLLRGDSFAVPEAHWGLLVLASFFNLGYWNIATSFAVIYLPSGHASVLSYTMPLWVALTGFLLFRQRLTGRMLLALLIGAAAVVALMLPNFGSYTEAPLGLCWGLSAGLSWALGTHVVKRTALGGMGFALTFWQVVLCVPPMIAGAFLLEGMPTKTPPLPVVLVTIYVGVGSMALGMALWFALVKRLPVQVAAISSIAVPIVAVLMGIVLLHEPLSLLQAMAIASTVISLWLALVPGRRVV
ncbi:MAG: DMT family transporter [Alphaproteobacteria bacterium]|nr:DMT family transporter [Alphaproteobacteria bacterium]